jgi:hypothetical protein
VLGKSLLWEVMAGCGCELSEAKGLGSQLFPNYSSSRSVPRKARVTVAI